MKRISLLITVLFIAAPLFVPPAYAKPAPPKDLLAIFNDFRELEESFEEKNWDKALKDTELIRERFAKILPELKKTSSGNVTDDFTALMANLKKAISDKNAESTHIVYIALQNMFFKIMDDYDYKLPPVIKVIDTYIAEALEGLEEKEYDKVVGEMEEVVSFVQKHAEKYLKDRVSNTELEDFKKTLIDVKSAAKEKNYDKSLRGLKRLKRTSEKFVKLF